MEAKAFTVKLDDYAPMGTSILPVPENIAAYFLEAGKKRMVCVLNGKHRLHCAINSRGEAGHYIMLSKRTREAFGLVRDDVLEVVLEADESEYGMPVPIEWEEVLLFDEHAAGIFEQLTPGRKRSILHLVASAKREETRINRALKIADNLKKGVRNPQAFLRNHD